LLPFSCFLLSLPPFSASSYSNNQTTIFFVYFLLSICFYWFF
jgi:hypothetical protein